MDPRQAGRTHGRTERPHADGRQDGRQGRQNGTPEQPTDGRTGCAYTHDGRQTRHDGRRTGRPTPLARAIMEETQKAVPGTTPTTPRWTNGRNDRRTQGKLCRNGRKAGRNDLESCAPYRTERHAERQDGTTCPERPTQGSSTHGRTERPEALVDGSRICQGAVHSRNGSPKMAENRIKSAFPRGLRYYCASPCDAGRGTPDVFGDKMQKKSRISLRITTVVGYY